MGCEKKSWKTPYCPLCLASLMGRDDAQATTWLTMQGCIPTCFAHLRAPAMPSSVQAYLHDLQLLGGPQFAIVQAVRALVAEQFPGVQEEVKYGGILFTAGVPFAGVFAYQAHVSVEFSHGAKVVDPNGQLEGKGKGRRHIKLHTVDDIQTRQLAVYLPLAHRAAGG
jgi:hypothetical protein